MTGRRFLWTVLEISVIKTTLNPLRGTPIAYRTTGAFGFGSFTFYTRSQNPAPLESGLCNRVTRAECIAGCAGRCCSWVKTLLAQCTAFVT